MEKIEYRRVYRPDSGLVYRFMTRLFALELEGISLRPSGISSGEVVNYLPDNPDDNEKFCVVAQETAEVIGMLAFNRYKKADYNHCGDFGMAVLPVWWRKGIGSNLLLEMEQWCRDTGVLKIELGVWSGNDGAVQLYEKHGFSHEGRRRNSVLRDGTFRDLLLMGKMVGTAR